MIEDVQNKIKLIKYSVKQWAGRNKFIVRGSPFMVRSVYRNTLIHVFGFSVFVVIYGTILNRF